MKDFDAVIFDMDGVIFDSEIKVIECWEELAERNGLKNIREPLNQCLGVTRDMSRGIMKAFYGEDFPYDEYAKEASVLFHSRYGQARRARAADRAEGKREKAGAGLLHAEKERGAGAERRAPSAPLRPGDLRGYGDAQQARAGHFSPGV